jgi:hypothetical protein
MKKQSFFLAILLAGPTLSAQPAATLFAERVRVINVIPNTLSGETGQDSEPQLAVDPGDTRRMVASSFTLNPTGTLTSAPIFISTNSGTTWAMNNIVPSGNGMTGDISPRFASTSHVLYTGILRGGSGLQENILRTADPFAATMMTTLLTRNNSDQPYTQAHTSGGNDRVVVGSNSSITASTTRKAVVDVSQNAATAAAPAGITSTTIERRNANREMPAIRPAIHPNGTCYAVFYNRTGGTAPNFTCDVVVTRDPSFGGAATPFSALTDPSDGLSGRFVVRNIALPAFAGSPNVGANRLVASNLSIAVDPSNAAVVYVAWADQTAGAYTLHVRRSADSGATWSADLLTLASATNPALAISSAGTPGFLYQQLTGGRWQTHFRRTSDNGATWNDLILADTPDNNPAPTFQPYIGDYVDLMAVGNSFYGIFSATNIPNNANFPNGVTYQRNANFTTNTLLANNNSTPVNPSIDPFFFSVRPGLIFDICLLNPNLCNPPVFDPGRLVIECVSRPCRVVDFIPKNCLVKWKCPGCDFKLCPPYLHIVLLGFDPVPWKIEVTDPAGNPVLVERNPVNGGVVISFRPSRRYFNPKNIGDYSLAFEADESFTAAKLEIQTRLEVSDYRFKEHIRFPSRSGSTLVRVGGAPGPSKERY